jgi:predicted ATPase/class 3 adenylate cyclase
VTFLFTDIEGSTQLWEKHPRTMGQSLAQHDALLRGVFTAHHGQVFKTVGDAFCVAFANSSEAVQAAAAAQRALADASWDDTGPLRVRMALHSGDVEQRDGDYFGQTLNRVARLLATGHGGQMLLSRVMADTVRDLLPPEWTLRDMGEHKLKDLSRPEHIFQLQLRDLPSEFPPLRSLEVLPNNLPAQVASFVGRAREVAAIKDLLNKSRLLTLTGPGGTGKTRLSLQVAAEVADRFPHGVWLVELATVSAPAQVTETIAGVLDIREERGRDLLDTVINALRYRQLLIILDNCEHLIAACARVAATLLRRCPNVRLLASSREALNIPGETVQLIPPLDVFASSDEIDQLSLDDIAGWEAVQLFVERAAASRPGLTLTRDNARLIARICWRLDGIPLAIELAAARVKVLTLEQILEQLDDRFHLLNAGSRVAEPRQQTLGALISWSYDLLSEPERRLLRRLGVFVAGRTAAMAEEVCAGDGVEKAGIRDLLSSLVEKSLLMVEPGADGENRYTMLESVWDYAEEKLAQHQETVIYRRKHLEFFTRFAEASEPQLFGRKQQIWLDRLSSENFNLMVALRFSRESPNTVELGLRLAGSLARYWEVRSYLTEGYEHFQALLAAQTALPPAVHAKAELGAGRLAWCQSRITDAARHYIVAQALFRGMGQQEAVAMIEVYLGFTERDAAHSHAARAHFYRALCWGEEGGFIRVLASALNGLSSLVADEGDISSARDAKQRVLAVFRSLGDQWLIALTTGTLGRVCFLAGDHAEALALLREFLKLVRQLGNKWTIPYTLELIADIHAQQNNVPRAVRLYGAASEQREALALDFTGTERTNHQAAVGRLRAALSADDFEMEWSQGRTAGLQAAIELAM